MLSIIEQHNVIPAINKELALKYINKLNFQQTRKIISCKLWH